jgi:methyltransferase (TIGR00027 family)
MMRQLCSTFGQMDHTSKNNKHPALKRHIEPTTSRTARMTCVSRACSALETNPCYKSSDYIAPLLLPRGLRTMFHISLARKLFAKVAAPKGIYEYVIARTKYIDTILKRALAEKFDQVIVFGAGFDTRALRFQDSMGNTQVFELDLPGTQKAKIGQYRKQHLAIPPGLVFISIDFDKESLTVKLKEAGFLAHQRTLFVLEGIVMYLQPKSVEATFQTIKEYAGKGSWIVFDFIYASVLRKEGIYYGEKGVAQRISSADEQWQFGIEKGEVKQFLAKFAMKPIDQKEAKDLELEYFSDTNGQVIGRVNGTHCLVTCEKQ